GLVGTGPVHRRLLAGPVVDAVGVVEEAAQAAAIRQALADADLAGVRIDDDVGAAAAGGRQGGRGLLAGGEDLVGALLAKGESQRLALLQLTHALGGPQAGTTGDDDHQLLVGVVEVVRVGGLAGGQLPEAGADQLGSELVADAGAAGAKPGRPLA